MKRVSTSALRQESGRVLAWVEQGEEVEITRRGRVIARLLPANGSAGAPPEQPRQERAIKMPGFESSLKKLFGE